VVLVTACTLTIGGLAMLPAAAIAGGILFVVLGACVAYDLAGLGDRWVAWKRDLGGPTLALSVWLDRTLDGAAVAWLGVAVAWLAAMAVV
jgi:hypothetical protein